MDIRAGGEVKDDVVELARLQAQMQKVLDRQKQKKTSSSAAAATQTTSR